MPERPPLRDRLLALRADVLRQLAEGEGIDGGLLALLGNVGAASRQSMGSPRPGLLGIRGAVVVM
jgi:hypothetical protein